MSRAAADTWIAQHEDTLANRLDARRDALDQKRWPQVLRTHTDANIPSDSGNTRPDALNLVTTDNGDGWDRLNLQIGGPWRAALEINNYGDSIGQGCEYVAFVREAGVLYRKVYKVEGHQQERLSGWVEMLPDPITETPTPVAFVKRVLEKLPVVPKPTPKKPVVVPPPEPEPEEAIPAAVEVVWWRRLLRRLGEWL